MVAFVVTPAAAVRKALLDDHPHRAPLPAFQRPRPQPVLEFEQTGLARIQHRPGNAVRQFVTVASVTTRVRSIRSEVLLGPEDGLRRRSVVNLDNINTIPKASLERRVAGLSDEKLEAVDAAIRFALALAE